MFLVLYYSRRKILFVWSSVSISLMMINVSDDSSEENHSTVDDEFSKQR